MSVSFDDFFQQRRKAADAYVSGDGGAVDALVPHAGEASFHSPGGDTVTGAAAVAERYLSDAKSFHKGGMSRLEVLQMGADGDIGFWTGYQVATARIGDMPKPVDMRIRITEIFRRIDGEWKMIHRHADFGKPSSR